MKRATRLDRINDIKTLQNWSRDDSRSAETKLYQFMIGERVTQSEAKAAQDNAAWTSDRMRKKLFELIDTVRK